MCLAATNRQKGFEDIASGKSPLTLEVVLIGVLGRVMYHLRAPDKTGPTGRESIAQG